MDHSACDSAVAVNAAPRACDEYLYRYGEQIYSVLAYKILVTLALRDALWLQLPCKVGGDLGQLRESLQPVRRRKSAWSVGQQTTRMRAHSTVTASNDEKRRRYRDGFR